MTMDPQANKDTIRLIREQAVSQRRYDLLDGRYARDYRYHGGAFGELEGPDAFKQLLRGMSEVLGVWEERVEDQIAEGDQVLTRLSGRGAVTGELLGVQGDGREVSMTALVLSRFNEAGQIVEEWVEVDALGMLQQLQTEA